MNREILLLTDPPPPREEEELETDVVMTISADSSESSCPVLLETVKM